MTLPCRICEDPSDKDYGDLCPECGEGLESLREENGMESPMNHKEITDAVARLSANIEHKFEVNRDPSASFTVVDVSDLSTLINLVRGGVIPKPICDAPVGVPLLVRSNRFYWYHAFKDEETGKFHFTMFENERLPNDDDLVDYLTMEVLDAMPRALPSPEKDNG